FPGSEYDRKVADAVHRAADSGERINRGPLANCTACDQAGSTCQQRGLFRRCDLFDWRSFGLGLLARFIGGVQEPIDQPSAALLHDLRVLGPLLVVVAFVIFRVAHSNLHLRSAPTVKQLRNTVYSSEAFVARSGTRRLSLIRRMGPICADFGGRRKISL